MWGDGWFRFVEEGRKEGRKETGGPGRGKATRTATWAAGVASVWAGEDEARTVEGTVGDELGKFSKVSLSLSFPVSL
jgi:hypothetical protein